MLLTAHRGFGTFRSSGAWVVGFGCCVYKHSAPPEPKSVIGRGLSRAVDSEYFAEHRSNCRPDN